MKIREIKIANCRSFLEQTAFAIEGNISIIVGPNGGGKTNLLDTIITVIRRHLMPSWFPQAQSSNIGSPIRYHFRHNQNIGSLILEKHTNGNNLPQIIEAVIEVTQQDIENIKSVKTEVDLIESTILNKYLGISADKIRHWDPDALTAGMQITYTIQDNSLLSSFSQPISTFIEYLQNFEWLAKIREENNLTPLSTPILYLPVNRVGGGFQSSVSLSGFNYDEQKQSSDLVTSRTAVTLSTLAIGRLAQQLRALLETDKGNVKNDFYNSPQMRELSDMLSTLGYKWELECINTNTNQYDVRLKKQGSSFLVHAASSGEKELLNYLFCIYGLNVRDALIVVDEPELHLHPKWQKALLSLFERLSASTGNQFILATHSAVFISPRSIEYVSRVYSDNQNSKIIKLNNYQMPEPKHLFSIVNSHNNESIFFADKVILVEGLGDKLFFESVIKKIISNEKLSFTYEVVAVGGKGFFKAYSTLLNACQIKYSTIADLDYVEQIGSEEIKALFTLDMDEIKKDVIDNTKSIDGNTLVHRIEEAIISGSWGDAKDTWEYIKNKRIKLKKDLSDIQNIRLKDFIIDKRTDGIYLLSNGDLESYLPIGYKTKSMDTLIRFLDIHNFWDSIGNDDKKELEEIINHILFND